MRPALYLVCLSLLLTIMPSVHIAYSAPPSIIAPMRTAMAEESVQAAVDLCRHLHRTNPGAHDYALADMIDFAMESFNGGRRDDALRIMEAVAEIHPDQAKAHSVLAQIYFYTNNRGRALLEIDRALELDPNRLHDVIFRKRLTLVPEDFIVPTQLMTDDFLIRPLRGADAELDYAAVMSSREHLKGVFGVGDWPEETLTLEEDRESLEGHEWEFGKRQAFCYTVMNHAESEVMGCIYIYPARLDEYDAHIVMWVTRSAFDRGLDPVLFESVKDWVAGDWPFEAVSYPGREIPFDEYWARLEAQDADLH